MINSPKVSIIILNWNGVDDTIDCIESMKKVTYQNYNIVVLDNGSSGKDAETLKEKYGDSIHLLISKKNLGFPVGCNTSIKYAFEQGATYVLLLNNDVIVDPDFLTQLVNISESDSNIGIVGSKIYYYAFPNRIQAVGGTINWFTGYINVYGEEEDKGQFDQIAERDFVWGTSLLLKKAVVEKIGYIDPYFFFGVEEYDYCTRAKRAGFKIVYAPKSKVWHKFGASRAKLPQYPDTQAVFKNERGFANYKYYYRLFHTFCPPVLFIFPFFNCTVLRVELIGRLFRLIKNGEWDIINNALTRRFSNIFRDSNKSD